MNKEELIEKIKQLADLTNDEKSELIGGLRKKKYGLVWENHPEEVEERLCTQLPVLVEDKSKQIASDSEGAPNHILIEGDNLEALTALTYTHEGKVDVIYIDPPYNTGNKDFVYNDSFVDSEDGYRHSKWLSFMEKRLRIAKKLLSERGVIFISIDDRELAGLKLLCDEIYSEYCFVSNIIWQKNYASKNNSTGIPAATEYLLVYSKYPMWTPNKLPRTDEMNSKYKNPDGDRGKWRSDNPCAPGAISHQGMVYAIQHPFTGEMLYPYNGGCWRYQQDELLEIMNGWCEYELRDLNDADKRAEVCGISQQDVRKGVKGIVLSKPFDESKEKAIRVLKKGPWPRFYFTKDGKGGIARKTYLDDVEGRLVTSFWPFTEVNHTDGAKKELKEIFETKIPFDTPKPIDLLKQVILISGHSTSLILDFFAGSGTTLHATMQLNKEDGGHRQCILVTNNENNICEEVTYERNKRVINGYTTPKGEHVEGLHGNNLRYYKVDFVPREDTVANRLALMQKATDLLCIKHDLYDEQKQFGTLQLKSRYVRYFSNEEQQMLVVYEPRAIATIVKELRQNPVLATKERKLMVYAYSDGAYAYSDEFEGLESVVELVALPDALNQAIRNILPSPIADTTLSEEGDEA